MPAHQEAERIREAVSAVRAAIHSMTGIESTILVVDDGSSDGTAELALAAGADRVLRHPRNLGLGAAVRSGLRAARAAGADVVVKIDADLQHDAGDLAALVRPVLDDVADLVYGDRFAGIEYRMPTVRRLGNRVFTWLMRRLTGWPVRDSQPGIFAASTAYLEGFRIPGDYNYTQQVLLDAYHRDLRFVQVPVAFRERTTGRSFVGWSYPFRVAKQLLLLLVALNPLRVFVPLGTVFLLVGLAILAADLSDFFRGLSRSPVRRPFGVLGFGLFGLQTVFFGVLGHLVIQHRSR